MTGALASALAAPLRNVQALVGPGWSGHDPAAAFRSMRDRLDDIADATERAWLQASAQWHGTAASRAEQFAHSAVMAIAAMSMTAGQLGDHTEEATAAVAQARERLRTLVEDFEARATLLESGLDQPGTAAQLVDEAKCALDEAIAVVDGLRAELGAHADAIAPAPTHSALGGPLGAPSALGRPSAPGVLGSAGGLGSAAGFGSQDWLGSGALGAAALGAAATPVLARNTMRSNPEALADPSAFGAEETVTLPNGATATAPNKVAADAVRHALTQLGVPYQWGGTTPGVGLDCSGLTQWAYHQAGMDIPRLAQEQDIGSAVGQAGLRPGDLAVWDGHVAMIVGRGTMIEAGDPVQLSPIRTTNAGQGFHGFFRPTG
ncbi:cell wall-associated NlpC family hydrolase [Mycobacterium sp. MAA66]|uniref:C40 family peptidase n=1 Tax=Mycobacterium sp. MAA66 TaxID=3156297 RepID=UPI003515273D